MRVFRQKYRDRGGKLRESSKWYAEFRDHNEVTRRLPGFSDKAATEELGRKVERLAACRANDDPLPADLGRWVETIPSAIRERLAAWRLLEAETIERRKPLAAHLDDFRRHLDAKNNTGKHVRQTVHRLTTAFDGCGFRRLADLSATRLSAWLKEQRDAEAIGLKTTNYYLAAAKQFGTWLVRDRRCPENPFVHLTGLNAKTDVRRERRSLSDEEISLLLKATEKSGDSYRGLTGADRAALYLTALCTGLRANELASLSESSFDFKAGTVTVAAAYSKRRREDVLPLHPQLADALQRWLAGRRQTADDREAVIRMDRPADAALWPGTWHQRSATMLRADLKAARAAWIKDAKTIAARKPRDESPTLRYETANGVADFHALRHTFITRLAQSGVHPKVAQELARHSTITLTMDRYSHVTLSALGDAVASLPAITTTQQTLAATGTDDREIAPPARPHTHSAASPARGNGDSVLPENRPFSTAEQRADVHLCASKPADGEKSENATIPLKTRHFQGDRAGSGGGTRTPDTRIMIPLL